MRILFISILLLILCPLTGVGIADERSNCIYNCENDKRANDINCTPADGYTDEDNKQCLDQNISAFNTCTNSCPPPEDQQPPETTSPSVPPEEPVAPVNPY